MGIFGSKKKFGLKEALVVVGAKPDITPDGAKTGAAFVEALGLPVTVVVETEAKITELNDSVKAAEEGIKVAKTELGTVPVLAKAAVNNLNVDLGKLAGTIREAILGKIDRIEDARDRKIAELEAEIEAVKDKTGIKGNYLRNRGERKVSKITRKIDSKIFEIEARLKGDLLDLKTRIADLEAETKSTKTEIGSLAKIKSLFA